MEVETATSKGPQEKTVVSQGGAASSAATYALFASVLCSVPTLEVRKNMQCLLAAAGDDEGAAAPELSQTESACDGHGIDRSFTQRFYDRMVIAVSPLYLPAVESCMLDARETEDGQLEPGHLDGRPMTEACACYKEYGYDPSLLRGFEPLVGSMRPDHLVAELGFMAHVRLVQSEGGPCGQAAAAFADQFLSRHLLRWVPLLHQMALQRGAEDSYVRLVGALCRWLAIDADAPSPR